MSNKVANALDLVSSFLEQAKAEKSAALKKKATDPSEPTSHPVMKMDDGTQPATEGSRSAENKSDVKKDYGSAGNTGQEDSSSASSPKQDIGTEKMESDETKGNVAKPKSTKDKPDESSSHPSNSTFSEKYSSLQKLGEQLATSIAELTKAATAKTAPTEAHTQTKKASAPASQEELSKEAELKVAAAQKYQEDAEAGYMAAEMLAKSLGFSKQASETDVAIDAALENVVKTAEADAHLFADYLFGHMEGVKQASAQRTKKAEGLPPEMMGGGAEGDPTADAALAGGQMGGGMPEAPMGGGGAPPEGGMGGGMDGGMSGGGDMGGGMGGGGGEEAILEALAQALEEAGISPEELVAALQQGGAGGGEGGGMGGMGGGGGGMGGGCPAPAQSAPPQQSSDAPSEGGEKQESPKKEESRSEESGDKKEEKKEAGLKNLTPKAGIPGKVRPSTPVKVAAEAVRALTSHARQTKMANVLRELAKKS